VFSCGSDGFSDKTTSTKSTERHFAFFGLLQHSQILIFVAPLVVDNALSKRPFGKREFCISLYLKKTVLAARFFQINLQYNIVVISQIKLLWQRLKCNIPGVSQNILAFVNFKNET
jgi:hypothetical protein